MTNRKVYFENETAKYRIKRGWISKDPFVGIRFDDLVDPLYMIRDPRAVLTSKHGRGYQFYWETKSQSSRRSPYPLKAHCEHLGQPRYRYEDLCTDPDTFQAELGREFGLEFDRPFSTWPWKKFRYPRYWDDSLGPARPIQPPRRVNGTDWPAEVLEWTERLGYEV